MMFLKALLYDGSKMCKLGVKVFQQAIAILLFISIDARVGVGLP